LRSTVSLPSQPFGFVTSKLRCRPFPARRRL
jgi:hypothetical protein